MKGQEGTARWCFSCCPLPSDPCTLLSSLLLKPQSCLPLEHRSSTVPQESETHAGELVERSPGTAIEEYTHAGNAHVTTASSQFYILMFGRDKLVGSVMSFSQMVIDASGALP